MNSANRTYNKKFWASQYPAISYRCCEICGDKIEEQHRPDLKICYGCRLDNLLPENYQRREEYEKVMPEFGDHKNAKLRPLTGLDILDASLGRKLSDLMDLIPGRIIESMSKREAHTGLQNSTYFNKELKTKI